MRAEEPPIFATVGFSASGADALYGSLFTPIVNPGEAAEFSLCCQCFPAAEFPKLERAHFSQQGSQEERQEAHNLPMREFDSRPCDHSGIGGIYAWIGREAPVRRGSIMLDDGGAFVAQVPEGSLAFESYFDRLNSIHQAERVHLVDESRKMLGRPAEWFATVDTP